MTRPIVLLERTKYPLTCFDQASPSHYLIYDIFSEFVIHNFLICQFVYMTFISEKAMTVPSLRELCKLEILKHGVDMVWARVMALLSSRPQADLLVRRRCGQN